jgi:hypothetical protein
VTEPPGPSYTELIPRPDPSKLTDEAIGRATAAYRRELDAMRELLAERIQTEIQSRDQAVLALRDLTDRRIADLDAALERRLSAVATLPDQVKADRRADLNSLRELLETRLTGMDKATELVAAQIAAVSDGIDEALASGRNEFAAADTALRELVETRLTGMDKATELLAADLRAVPSSLDERIRGLHELIGERLDAMDRATDLRLRVADQLPGTVTEQIDQLRKLHEERFSSIAQQFAERDVRTNQAQQASDQALNAALQAAKELVNAQGEASSAAAVKSETSFTKQIDQIGTIISTLEKALDARITELKERIDRGEGSNSGQISVTGSPFDAGVARQAELVAAGAQQRAVMAMVISGFLLLIALASLVFAIVKK